MERGQSSQAAIAAAPAAWWRRWGALVASTSGGWRWHLEAWRSQRRWAPTRAALASWLAGWQPPQRALLLVGPSAGWLLPPALLARFDRVDALEPDPLAGWLLRRRFPHPDMRLLATDYLAPGGEILAPRGLAALAAAFPHHAVLWCNLLSQIAGMYPAQTGATADPPVDAPAWAAWKTAFCDTFAGRSWASFHDRLSADRAPSAAPFALSDDLGSQALALRAWAAPVDAALAIYDHQLAGLAPGLPRQYVDWPRRPGLHHLVELIAEVAP